MDKGDVDVERNIRITLHQMPRLPVFTTEEYVAVFQNGPVKPSERTESDEPGSCSGSIVYWAGWLRLRY